MAQISQEALYMLERLDSAEEEKSVPDWCSTLQELIDHNLVSIIEDGDYARRAIKTRTGREYLKNNCDK